MRRPPVRGEKVNWSMEKWFDYNLGIFLKHKLTLFCIMKKFRDTIEVLKVYYEIHFATNSN